MKAVGFKKKHVNSDNPSPQRERERDSELLFDPVDVTLRQPAADMKHPDTHKTSTQHTPAAFQPTGVLTSAESVELLLAAGGGGDLGSVGGGGRDT